MIYKDWQCTLKFVKRMMCLDFSLLLNGLSPVYFFVTWQQKLKI